MSNSNTEENSLFAGASPAMRTTFLQGNGELETALIDYPNISGQLEGENEQGVKYPKRLHQL